VGTGGGGGVVSGVSPAESRPSKISTALAADSGVGADEREEEFHCDCPGSSRAFRGGGLRYITCVCGTQRCVCCGVDRAPGPACLPILPRGDVLNGRRLTSSGPRAMSHRRSRSESRARSANALWLPSSVVACRSQNGPTRWGGIRGGLTRGASRLCALGLPRISHQLGWFVCGSSDRAGKERSYRVPRKESVYAVLFVNLT
jgi:hypothetical protein